MTSHSSPGKQIRLASRAFIHRLAREQDTGGSASQGEWGCENNDMSSLEQGSSKRGEETVSNRRYIGVGGLRVPEILLDNMLDSFPLYNKIPRIDKLILGHGFGGPILWSVELLVLGTLPR